VELWGGIVRISNQSQLSLERFVKDRRLNAALSILDGDKGILEKNRKKIKQFLEYIRAEGLSTPRQVRYVYVLRKVSRLLGKEFRRTTKTDLVTVISELEKQDTSYDTKLSEKQCIKRFYVAPKHRGRLSAGSKMDED